MCPACPGCRPPPNFGPGSCTPSALDESCVCVCHSRVLDAHPILALPDQPILASSFSPSHTRSIPFFPPLPSQHHYRKDGTKLAVRTGRNHRPRSLQRLGSRDKGTPLSDSDPLTPNIPPFAPRPVPPPRLTRQPDHVLTPTPLGRRPFALHSFLLILRPSSTPRSAAPQTLRRPFSETSPQPPPRQRRLLPPTSHCYSTASLHHRVLRPI